MESSDEHIYYSRNFLLRFAMHRAYYMAHNLAFPHLYRDYSHVWDGELPANHATCVCAGMLAQCKSNLFIFHFYFASKQNIRPFKKQIEKKWSIVFVTVFDKAERPLSFMHSLACAHRRSIFALIPLNDSQRGLHSEQKQNEREYAGKKETYTKQHMWMINVLDLQLWFCWLQVTVNVDAEVDWRTQRRNKCLGIQHTRCVSACSWILCARMCENVSKKRGRNTYLKSRCQLFEVRKRRIA